ncbi:MAG: mannonate dehydratase [Chloroflexota bacterium]|nr:mannonate dehydratase [Chloroflexota bacterium]
MYLGEQLPNPSDARLTLAAQLGVAHIAIEMGSELYDASETGRWDVGRIRHVQARAAANGIAVDVIGLEMGSLLLDIIRGNTERRDAQLAVIAHNIRAAGEAGVPCLKYNLHIIGIPRTGRTAGRGGALYPHFDIAEATDEALAAYTGVAPGQSRAAAVGPVAPQESWDAFAWFLERAIPVAEECGVALAFHPQDPPLPHDTGLRGFHHVLGSVDGLKRYLDFSPSRYHVMNFCQGTVAEMCADPATEVLDAIRYFGGRKKIFMVHFRNITGGYLHFDEVYPDNGDVDMHAALRVYKEVGYGGMICPDHVPTSAVDPDKERQFAFCLGYIRALIQVVEREA